MARTRTAQRRSRLAYARLHCITASNSWLRRWIAQLNSPSAASRRSKEERGTAIPVARSSSSRGKASSRFSSSAANPVIDRSRLHGPWLSTWWEQGQQKHEALVLAASITARNICSSTTKSTISRSRRRHTRVAALRCAAVPDATTLPSMSKSALSHTVCRSSVTSLLSAAAKEIVLATSGASRPSVVNTVASSSHLALLQPLALVDPSSHSVAVTSSHSQPLPLQLFVRTVFQQASLSIEVQPDSTLADLSHAVLTSLRERHPVLVSLPQLNPSGMAFSHATRRLPGDDTQSCIEAGLRHGDSLQLTMKGIGGLYGGSDAPINKEPRTDASGGSPASEASYAGVLHGEADQLEDEKHGAATGTGTRAFESSTKKEHSTNARPSTAQKHQKGQAAKQASAANSQVREEMKKGKNKGKSKGEIQAQVKQQQSRSFSEDASIFGDDEILPRCTYCALVPQTDQKLMQCSRCKADYCGKKCQKADWKAHKVTCKTQHDVSREEVLAAYHMATYQESEDESDESEEEEDREVTDVDYHETTHFGAGMLSRAPRKFHIFYFPCHLMVHSLEWTPENAVWMMTHKILLETQGFATTSIDIMTANMANASEEAQRLVSHPDFFTTLPHGTPGSFGGITQQLPYKDLTMMEQDEEVARQLLTACGYQGTRSDFIIRSKFEMDLQHPLGDGTFAPPLYPPNLFTMHGKTAEQVICAYVLGHGISKEVADDWDNSELPLPFRTFWPELRNEEAEAGHVVAFSEFFSRISHVIEPFQKPIRKGFRNKHLVLIIDTCFSGLEEGDEDESNYQIDHDLLANRECSITIQTSSTATSESLGFFFTPLLQRLQVMSANQREEAMTMFRSRALVPLDPDEQTVTITRWPVKNEDEESSLLTNVHGIWLFTCPRFFRFFALQCAPLLLESRLDQQYLTSSTRFWGSEKKRAKTKINQWLLEHHEHFDQMVMQGFLYTAHAHDINRGKPLFYFLLRCKPDAPQSAAASAAASSQDLKPKEAVLLHIHLGGVTEDDAHDTRLVSFINFAIGTGQTFTKAHRVSRKHTGKTWYSDSQDHRKVAIGRIQTPKQKEAHTSQTWDWTRMCDTSTAAQEWQTLQQAHEAVLSEEQKAAVSMSENRAKRKSWEVSMCAKLVQACHKFAEKNKPGHWGASPEALVWNQQFLGRGKMEFKSVLDDEIGIFMRSRTLDLSIRAAAYQSCPPDLPAGSDKVS
jgi:hypothetical protein